MLGFILSSRLEENEKEALSARIVKSLSISYKFSATDQHHFPPLEDAWKVIKR